MTDQTDYEAHDDKEDSDEAGQEAHPYQVKQEPPAKGSVEEAALKIDALMAQGRIDEPADPIERAAWLKEQGEWEPDGARPDPDAPDGAPDSEDDAESDDPDTQEIDAIRIEVDGEEREVPIEEITKVYSQAGKIDEALEGMVQHRTQVSQDSQGIQDAMNILLPMLKHQAMRDFPDVHSQADIEALAVLDPARYQQYLVRQQTLNAAEVEVDKLEEFNYQHTFSQEAERLGELVPELKAKGGDALRDEIHDYATKQGFDDDRLRYATAAEVATLYKAMKFDRLEGGKERAQRSAKKAKRVMRPGANRERVANEGLARAMAKLKRTGSIDDAAAAIELLL